MQKLKCLSNDGSVWYVGVKWLCCETLLLLNMADMSRLLCVKTVVSKAEYTMFINTYGIG